MKMPDYCIGQGKCQLITQHEHFWIDISFMAKLHSEVVILATQMSKGVTGSSDVGCLIIELEGYSGRLLLIRFAVTPCKDDL